MTGFDCFVLFVRFVAKQFAPRLRGSCVSQFLAKPTSPVESGYAYSEAGRIYFAGGLAMR